MIRSFRIALFVCAAGVLLAAGDPAGPDAAAIRARAALAQLPLRFEANQGQFDSSVRFAARAPGYTLSLTAQGPSLVFGHTQRVTLNLPGSNAAPRIEPQDRLSTRTDYLVGPREKWQMGVATYASVRYRDVYPGIDMVYYGQQNQLEYDFVLQPGADPHAIRMHFEGGGKLTVNAEGDLALEASGGLIQQKKPVIYQQDRQGQRHTVTGRYVLLAEDVAGIALDSYDRSQALVIDPVIVYTTLIGGSATDMITAVKFTTDGLLYIAGWTQTSELPFTDVAYKNLTDSFVEIVDTNSTGGYGVRYFTYLGGSALDYALALDVDSSGDVYVTGYTSSTDLPLSSKAFQTVGALSTFDAFAIKINPSKAGTTDALLFSSYLGGAVGDERGKGVAAGSNGMMYIGGTTKSPDFPTTDNAYASSLYGPSDCFLSQVDTVNGTLVYSTVFGSENDDDCRGIALAPNGQVYFVATTIGNQFPMAGLSYNAGQIGNYDIIVGAFDLKKSGVDSLVYATYFGGAINDEVRGIGLDSQGRLLLTGYTLSTNFPTTRNAIQTASGGNGDAFVAIVDPTKPGAGFLVYSTYLGAAEGEVGYGVAGDKFGYVYVTGYTLSSDFPVTDNAPQRVWGGGVDMFVTRINPSAAGKAGLDYSTYIGVDSTIVGCCLAVANDGRLFVAGYTEGYLPLVGNSVQLNYGGGYSDGFLLVLSPGTGYNGTPIPPSMLQLEEPSQTVGKGLPQRLIRNK